MYVQIKSISDLTPSIRSYELVAEEGGELPMFTAGSHIDVILENGLTRQYSLSNCDSERHHYVIGVLNDLHSRGGSSFIHDQLKIGDRVHISEPRNLFPIHQNTNQAILFAGGIGITPILSMAYNLKRRRVPFKLYYFVKDEPSIAFREILKKYFSEEIHFHIDSDSNQHIDIGDVLGKPALNQQLYVCGPNGFMDFIFKTAEKYQWSNDHLHKEHFSANSIDYCNSDFSIKIASTGQLIEIAVDESVTEALEKNGFSIPVSCEQGICGTCLTNVIEGEPDHRDMLLTDEERASNKVFTPCCSRSKSKILVLDL